MNKTFAISFNIITVVFLSIMRNIFVDLENAFDEVGVDDIHITTEITETKNFIEYLDVDSDEFMTFDE